MWKVSAAMADFKPVNCWMLKWVPYQLLPELTIMEFAMLVCFLVENNHLATGGFIPRGVRRVNFCSGVVVCACCMWRLLQNLYVGIQYLYMDTFNLMGELARVKLKIKITEATRALVDRNKLIKDRSCPG